MLKVLHLLFILGILLSPISSIDGLAGHDPNIRPLTDQVSTNSQSILKGPFYPADTSGLPPAPSIDQLELHQVEGELNIPVEHPGTLPIPKTGINESSPGLFNQAQQSPLTIGSMPSTVMNWEGISSLGVGAGVLPPDTDGQVGPNHYVQIVNHGTTGAWVRVWDKSGNQLYNFGMNALWPAGDPCYDHALGDPVVLYDQEYDRWLLTQFTSPPFSLPYYECIAISKGPNPTNIPVDWYPYSFPVHNTNFPDYPKFAVWPDGYYMMAHQFSNGWKGTGIWVFEKYRMLAGLPATFQYIDLLQVNASYGGMLPSNWMGATSPAPGAPNYFIEVDQDWSGSNDILTIFEAQSNWPGGFTFTVADELVVDPFIWSVCPATRGRCIHQPDSAPQLEAISDRLMMHAWYRNYGGYEAIVANHTVNVGSNRAGIRWYELRKNSGSSNWFIFQQGTYAPDSDHRWMGSIAMDKAGNIALGYSVSSESVFPSIRYTGRLSTDPLGTMPQGEGTIIDGSGVQTYSESPRWGDYSAMSIDPVDDCTFWYTQEYIQTTGSAPWQTRVASFKFPNCTADPKGLINGTVTNASNGEPIIGGAINIIDESSGTELHTATAADGSYSIFVPVDTYTASASEFGYFPQTFTGLVITDSITITQDFALNPAPMVTISGMVKDAATGWPLYANVEVTNEPVTPVWTDPLSGYYEFQIPDGNSYDLRANAFVPGYFTEEVTATVSGDTTKNIELEADLVNCEAPGYQSSPCSPQSGGLVVGNVYDNNTSEPLNSAIVSNEDLYSTITKITPQDENVDDGFFTIFSPAGNKTFTSTKSGGYGSVNQSVTVVVSDTINKNFQLPAGLLNANPERLEVNLTQGLSTTLSFDLENSGGLPADFLLFEIRDGFIPLGPYQNPLHIIKRHKQSYRTTENLELPDPPAATLLTAGNVLQSWTPTLLSPWGIVYDKLNDHIWISSPHANWLGDDKISEFTTAGTPTGREYTHSIPHTNGPADLAFNWLTGKIWIMNTNSGISNCIYEIDPSFRYTGNSICPGGGTGFDISQRGLAYDPASDTYFAGGWNDLSIHRFSADGTLLSSVNVGLAISGLAYNPHTEHLFVMVNADPNPLYVLDTADNYNLVGQFNVSQDFSAYSGAGLEFDCDGKLWAVDQQLDSVYQIESGESAADLCAVDIPWLDENPPSGSVNSLSTEQIDVLFDASVPEVNQPGDYFARIKVDNDSPYGPLYIPISMAVKAPDIGVTIVPDSADSGLPGATVTYTLQVKNTSNELPDTFDIFIVGNSWKVSHPLDTGVMAPNESKEIKISIQIPLTANIGDEDSAQVNAVSQSDSSKKDVAIIITNVKGYKFTFPLAYK